MCFSISLSLRYFPKYLEMKEVIRSKLKDDTDAHIIDILKKLHAHLSHNLLLQLYNKKVRSLSTAQYQNSESFMEKWITAPLGTL